MSKIRNLFITIRRFFSKTFKSPKLMIDSSKENIIENRSINLINDLKKDNKKSKTTEEIIHIIENNPMMLKSLNIKKLDIIEEYYKNKIVETEKNIKKVKNSIHELEDYLKVLDEKIACLESE